MNLQINSSVLLRILLFLRKMPRRLIFWDQFNPWIARTQLILDTLRGCYSCRVVFQQQSCARPCSLEQGGNLTRATCSHSLSSAVWVDHVVVWLARVQLLWDGGKRLERSYDKPICRTPMGEAPSCLVAIAWLSGLAECMASCTKWRPQIFGGFCLGTSVFWTANYHPAETWATQRKLNVPIDSISNLKRWWFITSTLQDGRFKAFEHTNAFLCWEKMNT